VEAGLPPQGDEGVADLHANVATAVGNLATWTKAAEKTAKDMKAEVKALTSHIEALEFQSTKQPKAPPRKEEGWAKATAI
jgi:hypothetical protein